MVERTASHPIEDLFLQRWSPRAFDGRVIERADLLTMFEAARWAPSAFNQQPWRFIYAETGTDDFATFCELLIPFNASWARSAGALVFVLSYTLTATKPGAVASVSHSNSFDTGAAWALFALQATQLGYYAHGMTGVDFALAREKLHVPAQYRLEAAAGVGRRGDPSILPESLRAREAPSPRKPLTEILFEGRFPDSPDNQVAFCAT